MHAGDAFSVRVSPEKKCYSRYINMSRDSVKMKIGSSKEFNIQGSVKKLTN